MKRHTFVRSCLGIAIFVLATSSVGFAAPKVQLKAVSAWPITHVGNDYYKEFIKRVNEKSKGEIEIKLLGGPEVISAFDQLKALSSEVVDVVHAANSYYAGMVPEGTIIDLALPKGVIGFLRESGALNTYVQAYKDKSKAVFLGVAWVGMPFYLMTNKAVASLDDVRGLKLRSMGGLIDLMVGGLGASVVKIASAETYEGLQRGIVDGAVRNSISLVEFKEYEVLKYVITPAFCTSTGSVWIGEKKWNAIPKNLQDMIVETMLEVEKEAFSSYSKMDKDRLFEARDKHGMKIVQLSERDVAKLNEIRVSAPIRSWINSKTSPKYGPEIFEKMLPHLK